MTKYIFFILLMSTSCNTMHKSKTDKVGDTDRIAVIKMITAMLMEVVMFMNLIKVVLNIFL
jgi:hypothetical protein